MFLKIDLNFVQVLLLFSHQHGCKRVILLDYLVACSLSMNRKYIKIELLLNTSKEDFSFEWVTKLIHLNVFCCLFLTTFDIVHMRLVG